MNKTTYDFLFMGGDKMSHSHINENISHQHTHKNTSEHHHDSKSPVILFFTGLTFFLISLLFNIGNLEAFGFLLAIAFAGYHVILEGIEETITDTKDKGKFTPNVHILMTLAALGAVIIGNYEEGALLILIFAGAHFLEEYAEGKSKREITKLLKMNPTEARLLLSDGSTQIVSVNSLNIGDQVQVLHGDQVPTDGVIISGATTINESAINGESMPKEKTVDDEVFGGTMNGSGNFVMTVTKDSSDTVFARILQLVSESQKNMSPTATRIKKIEPIYVKIILMLLPVVVLIGLFVFQWSLEMSLYRTIVFLISASPCALAGSAVPATLSAISNLAKRGILFKGGSYLANLSEIKAIAFDKTGTLTEGKPKVMSVYFNTSSTKCENRFKNIVYSMEKNANHPLATAIVQYFDASTNAFKMEVANEIGTGLTAEFEGNSYQIGKPSIFEAVDYEIITRGEELANQGQTVVYFSENEIVVGLISLMDAPNEKAHSIISYFKSQNIHTTLITGDSKKTGHAVGRALDIDEVVANVMPENKSEIINQQKVKYGITGMVGDGINDAPALVNADIGIAMGEGTDIAIDVSDVVLMQNDLSKLKYAHQISKKMNRVIYQNIIFSLFVILLLITLNFLGKMDIAIGVIAHEGSTLIVILNGLRLLLTIKE